VSKEGKGESWKSPLVILNIIIIIVAIISIIVVAYFSNQQLNMAIEQFEKEFNLLREQFDRQINETYYLEREFHNNTFGKIIVYYPENQTGDTRYEIILMALNNSLFEGLYNVEFVVSPNIEGAKTYATLTMLNWMINFKPEMGRHKEWLNNSILLWEKNIPQNQLIYVELNLTWDTNWHPNRIDYEEIYFKMYANDRLINLTGKIGFGTAIDIINAKS
jgi:isocitrate lyase